MLSIQGSATRLCDGVSRREVLRAGGLSLLGLSLPDLLRASDQVPPGVLPTDKTFGRAKSIIYLWLAGGPPQHETFDPKPLAPAEIRGPFKPISTNVPGIQFCELLPRTAAIADKLAVIRSLSTNDNNHDSSGYWVWTGYPYQGPNSRTIQPTDWPYFGSVVKRLKPSDTLPPLSSVWIPDVARLNENVTPAGQTGGIMGAEWDPDRFIGDPADPQYQVAGLQLSGLPPARLKRREALLKQVERSFATAERSGAVRLYDGYQRQAFDLLTSGKAREAFELSREPDSVRDRYGRNRWGQCVLLARRLVEAGVRLVHVQWPREPGDNAVDNPLWDTHAQNFERVEDVLCPQFDLGFTALIEDLHQRGLLDETLVVAVGEFGRTPKVNGNGGRDHWGPVFSCALAGAGISGGQVYGASDAQGAYPSVDKVEPGQLTATLFHLLGVSHLSTFQDREGREHRITPRDPLYKLLGLEPATSQRAPCTGDVARVPAFDERLLLVNDDFSRDTPLLPAAAPVRPKGWKGLPRTGVDAGAPAGWGVGYSPPLAQIGAPFDRRHATLGFDRPADASPAKLAKGNVALLCQEVRSPFAGKYTARLHAVLDATTTELHEQWFAKHFSCKLVLFQYTQPSKDPTHRKELASVAFTPSRLDPMKPALATFELTKEFLNPTPGANFSFGLGLGVGVQIEKTSDGELELPGGARVLLRVARLELEFVGKARNNDVIV